MKRLIKRYVLKAQVDKENDEVNEGELKYYSFEKSQVMIILISHRMLLQMPNASYCKVLKLHVVLCMCGSCGF